MVPLPVLLWLPHAMALEQRLALALVLGQRVGLELPVKVVHTLALAKELPKARLALPQWEGEGGAAATDAAAAGHAASGAGAVRGTGAGDEAG